MAEAEEVPEEDGGYFPGDAEGDQELAGDKPRKVRRSRTTFTTFQLHQLEVSSTQPLRSLDLCIGLVGAFPLIVQCKAK